MFYEGDVVWALNFFRLSSLGRGSNTMTAGSGVVHGVTPRWKDMEETWGSP